MDPNQEAYLDEPTEEELAALPAHLRLKWHGWYFPAKAMWELGFDVTVHDPDIEDVQVWWSGTPHHGVLTVKPADLSEWQLVIGASDEGFLLGCGTK